MEEMEKQVRELLNHCRNCPFFDIGLDGNKELYRCSLLEDEVVAENEEADPEYIPDGTEGLLAVARYTIDGKLIEFDILDFYPQSCPKEKK